MIQMQIDIDMDQVCFEGQIIRRPICCSRKMWLDYWESFRDLDKLIEKVRDEERKNFRVKVDELLNEL